MWHHRCAMKVGVDGVMLGAWADVRACRRILDVGTGSGLIALMLAQRARRAHIDAIDIDAEAALQARSNVEASPWADRISVQHVALQQFTPAEEQGYRLIVCNPPFFTRSTPAPAAQRALARHDGMLPHDDLLCHALRLLDPGGRLCVILPVAEGERFVCRAAEAGLWCRRRVSVRPRADKAPKRLLLEMSRHNGTLTQGELVIHADTSGRYTEAFARLTRDFYLGL